MTSSIIPSNDEGEALSLSMNKNTTNLAIITCQIHMKSQDTAHIFNSSHYFSLHMTLYDKVRC